MVTINTEHYIRLLLLNAKGATPVLRETLINFVNQTSNKTVGDFLLTFGGLFKTLKGKRILNESEYNKLLQGSAVDINEWDTSLLCFVLLNCCSLQGKLNEFRGILLKEANNDLDTFVQVNKATIDTYKGNGISEEQYNIMFPAKNIPTDTKLWDMDLITFILINVCTRKVQLCVLEFRRLLQTELELKTSSLNLTAFLKYYEGPLRVVKARGKLDESQFNDLFPSSGLITDIYKWDTKTLRIVVLNCTSSLSNQAVQATKQLREIRNNCLAHREKAEMENLEYLNKSKDLLDAIEEIIVNEKLPIKSNIDEIVKELINGPINIKTAIDILKDYYTIDSSNSLQILKILDDVESKINAIEDKMTAGFQRMDVGFGNTDSNFQEVLKYLDKIERKLPDTEYSHQSEIRCVDILLVIKSQTEIGRQNAETLIENAMKNNGATSSEQIRAAVFGVFKEIVNDGRTIVEIKRGSVILAIKCDSLKALHELLKCVASEDMKNHLNTLSSAVSEAVGESVYITSCLSEISVLNACKDVIRNLLEYTASTSSLRVTVQADPFEDLQRIVDDFKGAPVKSQLQSLSQGLSTYLGEDISVGIVVPDLSCITELQRDDMDDTLSQHSDHSNLLTHYHLWTPDDDEEEDDNDNEDDDDDKLIDNETNETVRFQTQTNLLEDIGMNPEQNPSHLLEDSSTDVNIDDTQSLTIDPNKKTSDWGQTMLYQSKDSGIAVDGPKIRRFKGKLLRDYKDFLEEINGKMDNRFHDINMLFASASHSKTVAKVNCTLSDILHGGRETSVVDTSVPLVGAPITLVAIVQDWIDIQDMPTEKMNGQQKFLNTFNLLLITDKRRELPNVNIIGKCLILNLDNLDHNLQFILGRVTKVSWEHIETHRNMQKEPFNQTNQSTIYLLNLCSKKPQVESYFYMDHANNATQLIIQEIKTSSTKVNTIECDTGRINMLVFLNKHIDDNDVSLIRSKTVKTVHFHNCELSCFKSGEPFNSEQHNYKNIKSIVFSDMKTETDLTFILKAVNLIQMTITGNIKGWTFQFPTTKSLTNLEIYNILGPKGCTQLFINSLLPLVKLNRLVLRKCSSMENENIEFPVTENLNNLLIEEIPLNEKLMTSLPKLTGLTQLTLQKLSNVTKGLKFPVMNKLTSLVINDIWLNGESTTELMKSLSNLTGLTELTLHNLSNVNDEGLKFPIMHKLTSLVINDMWLNEESTTVLMKSLSNLTGLTELKIQDVHSVNDGDIKFPVMNKLTSLVINDVWLNEESTTVLMKSLSNLTGLTDLKIQDVHSVNDGGLKFPVMNKLTSLVINDVWLNGESTTVLMKSLSNLTCLTKLTLHNLSNVDDEGLKFPVMNKLTSLVINDLLLNGESTTEWMKSLSNLTGLTELTLHNLSNVNNEGLKFPVMNKLTSLVINDVWLNGESTTVLMKSLSNLTCLTKLTLHNLSNVDDEGLKFPVMNKLTSLVINDLLLNGESTTELMKSLSNLTGLTELTLHNLSNVNNEGLKFPVMNKLTSLVINDVWLNGESTTVLMKSLSNLTCLTKLTLHNLSNVDDEGLKFPVMNKLTSLVINDLLLNGESTTELMKSLSNLTGLTELTLHNLSNVNNEGLKFPVMNKLTSLVINDVWLNGESTTELMKSLSNLTGLTELTLHNLSNVNDGGLKYPVMHKLTSLVINDIWLNGESTTELMKSLSNLTGLTELTLHNLSNVNDGGLKFPVMHKLTSLVINDLWLNEESTTVLIKSLSNLTGLTKLKLQDLDVVWGEDLKIPKMATLRSLVIEGLQLKKKSMTELKNFVSNLMVSNDLQVKNHNLNDYGDFNFPVMNTLAYFR